MIPTLSICIPTYNRGKLLYKSILSLKDELVVLANDVNIKISDNCSTDNTKELINDLIRLNINITYCRNEQNLGMDRNFAKSLRAGNGKYTLLLGDDDIFIPGKLTQLVEILKHGEYGIVEIIPIGNKTNGETIYYNSQRFLRDISYWITFISSNVVLTKFIKNFPFEKYFGTVFCQVPLYITAISKSKINLLLHEDYLVGSFDAHNAGHYNLFRLFCDNLLSIFKEYKRTKNISWYSYQIIKFKLFRYFQLRQIISLLIRKEPSNFDLRNSWSILLKWYWYVPYFYIYLFLAYSKHPIRNTTALLKLDIS